MTSKNDQIELNPHGRILVVDDEPRNRKLLRDMLEVNGHTVIEAEDGVTALEKVASEACDVILLDVIMPRMNGFETCRQLKTNPETTHIPVLMVTALTQKEEQFQGIAAGANDYLTKPINQRDVLLRVCNAVRLNRLHENLRSAHRRLVELQELKDNLTHMVIHDLRAPLTVVLGYLEILPKSLPYNLSAKDVECIASALAGTHRLADMITSLLDVTRLESQAWILAKTDVNMNVLITEAIRHFSASGAETPIDFCPAPSPARVPCDCQLIERVVINLLSNAVKYAGPQGKVGVSVEDGDRKVTVRVTDNGPGIPPEYHRKIFEKFGAPQLHKEANLPSVGLGLAFCKLAVEAHGGKIGVTSQTGQGSTFTFSLPWER